MEGLKTNCILYNCIESVFIQLYNIQFYFKLSNPKSTSQQCKICALTDQQNFPNWGSFVEELKMLNYINRRKLIMQFIA